MKKIFIGALCVAAALSANADNAKINMAGKAMMMEQQLNPSRAASTVNALVIMAPGYTVADLSEYPVLAAIGDDRAVVELTLSEVEKLSEAPMVERISFGETVSPCLDVARKDAAVDPVQQGEGLSSAYNATGVIAGIFDNGIDPNHITFTNADGQSRVKRFYNANSGRTYTEENIANATTDDKSATHGTHCAGIMGGSYNGTGKIVGTRKLFGKDVVAIVDGNVPFYGVARDADLYLSGGTLINTNILVACQKIADYAKEQGKPAVINLSLGSVSGAHDGSSDFCQSLDKIAASGPLIFVAAGNEGTDNMSIRKQLTASDNMIKTFASSIKGNQVEFWASNNGAITGTFGVYNQTTGEFSTIREISSSKNQSVTISGPSYPSYEHNTNFNNAFTSSSYVIIEAGVRTTNKRSYVTFYLNLEQKSETYIPVFYLKGNAGQTVLATVNKGSFGNMGLAGFDAGSPDNTINEMATGKNVIAVGSYNTRLSWKIFNNNSPQEVYYSGTPLTEVGNVSDFSSCGTTFDGETLPHICAPGMGVISSYSTPYMEGDGKNEMGYICASADANGRNNYWVNEQGTSMATPFAAGTVALWLQADPTLTRNKVLEIFKKTAVRDEWVQNGNPVKWGYGKLNALNGIKHILGDNAVGQVYDDENLRLIVTNESGKMFNILVAGENGFNARLYSMSGSLMKSASTSDSQMDLDASDLNSGVYILEITGETSRFTRKVTVK